MDGPSLGAPAVVGGWLLALLTHTAPVPPRGLTTQSALFVDGFDLFFPTAAAAATPCLLLFHQTHAAPCP